MARGHPNEDPDGNSQSISVDLRFPGHIASDGGVYYNYFRDYDPSTGRYIESEPIGLDGVLNAYGYVGVSPLGGCCFVWLYQGLVDGYMRGQAQALKDYGEKMFMASAVAVDLLAAPEALACYAAISEAAVVSGSLIAAGTLIRNAAAATRNTLICDRNNAALTATCALPHAVSQQRISRLYY